MRIRFINLRLVLAFTVALLSAALVSAWFPSWKLTFFAPFVIITYYKKSFSTSLWLSILAGLSMDLMSDQHHLGLHAFNYCLTTSLLYWQKRNFFEDSLSTIPIMTFFFALISTLIQMPLYSLFEKRLPLSIEWIWTDLIVFPLLDAIYGFVVFGLVPVFLPRSRKRDYFME